MSDYQPKPRHYPDMNNLKSQNFAIVCVLASVISYVPTAIADDDRYELGFRAETNLGPGVPANDMIGFSFIGRYRLNENWLLGLALEHSPEFDVEDPFRRFNIDAETNDPAATSTMISAWGERRYWQTPMSRYLFWTAGMGINQVDVDDLVDTDNAGNPYDISTAVDSEIALTGSFGQRHRFGSAFSVGYGARVEYRLTEWTFTNRETDETATVDDYFVHGAFVDINYAF